MVKNAIAEAVQAAFHATPPLASAVADPSLLQCPSPPDGWVGIDVAKAPLEVAIWPVAERQRVGRDEAGLNDLIGWLPTRKPTQLLPGSGRA